jgi:pimeloyl-ACP methyl ester carboxylesterase
MNQHHTQHRIQIDDVDIDIVEIGAGRPLLFLHPLDGLGSSMEALVALGEDFRVIAPWHPGFGHSELPPEFRTIADLVLFYRQLVDQLDIKDAVLVGNSFGGWLAAELAVQSVEAFTHLVLVDPVGIKVGARDERDITDIYALSQAELATALYHDPSRALPSGEISDVDALGIARSREAHAYFGWKPYLHNPGLRRWLRRISIPTLVLWGASDGIVGIDYGRAFSSEIPNSTFVVLDDAGHYPQVEQPEKFYEAVVAFAADPQGEV